MLLRLRGGGPIDEELLGAHNWLKVWLGVEADLSKLEVEEQVELVRLVEIARTEDGGIRRRALRGVDLRRFEALVEKAAGYEQGWFGQRRQDAKTLREIVEIAHRARRPAQPTEPEERGCCSRCTGT